jgi:hypothetical protein
MSLDWRVLRHLDARQRGCVGANILAQPGPFKPPASLLAAILRVSPRYIAIANAMSQAKRNAIIAGYDKSSFVPLLNAPKAPLALPAPVKPMINDVEIIDYVRRVGIGRVLDAAVAVEAAQ